MSQPQLHLKKFLPLVVIFFVAAWLIGRKALMNSEKNSQTTTAPAIFKAVLTGEIELPLSPENISTIPLYQIHTNLWGTLLSKEVGQGLATVTKVSADEKQIWLKLKPSMKFSDGSAITSSDVVFSINRLMARQESGHFNAKAVIEKVAAISDDEISISLNFPSKAFQYLLSMSEMGVLPKKSLDQNGELKCCAVRG